MRSLTWIVVLTASVLPAATLSLPDEVAANTATDTPPPSTYIGTAEIEPSNSIITESTGDLWPSCWAENGNLYTANGDGRGFSVDVPASDIVMNEVRGDADNLTGEAIARADELGTIWNPEGYNRKPTGMLCVGDTIYLAVQDLALDFNDVPAATIAKSTDHGRTWSWDESAPMFDDHTFTTIWFADFGRGNANAPDRYAYAYGLDGNWRDSATDKVPDPQDVFLARVPVDKVQDRQAWRFFAGVDAKDRPRWSADIDDKAPVLTDTRRLYQQRYGTARGDLTVISQGGVTYLPKSRRYIYASWTGPTFELYESPTPWGPWRHVASRDFGGTPWSDDKHGGYATTIPSKFISDDERTLYIQSNVFCCGELQTRYNYGLRKLELVPADRSPASNPPEPANLAELSDAVAISKSSSTGRLDVLHDGATDVSENDFDDEVKPFSWWGYTWPRQLNINRVDFTTGEMSETGGWFNGRPRVQVRQDGEWVDVAKQTTTPPYPGDASAGEFTTYTMTFLPVQTDGVRVLGAAGGTRTFSSVSELAASYVPQVANAGWEAASGGTPAWEFEGLAGHGTDRGVGNAHAGENNGWIRTERSDWSAYTQTVPVRPGETYTFAGWFRSSSALQDDHGALGVRAGDDTLGERTFGAAGSYTRHEVTVTIPADTHEVTVYAGFTGSGVDTWLQLDDFTVEPADG